MKSLRGILALLLACALFICLNKKIGSAPPAGSFLSPFTGFWQNAESGKPNNLHLRPEGLQRQVTVLYDTSRVPHIFAENDEDLYFAQGYITARDRLWQMEFQTHAAAGRISEIVGPMAVDFDRHQRRMGMVYGARNSLELMMSDPRSRAAVESYTAGINAYIRSLRPRDYPFEYKLLDYAPEEWTPLKCALLLKQMTKTLNGGSDDYYLSNVLARYGREVADDLFPDRLFMESPVIPADTPWEFEPLPLPQPPDTLQPSGTGLQPPPPRRTPGIGSNNWVVAGSRTASGRPILANDPHLDLTLPSLWYQVQLSAPGVNVCGASLPGAPGVIIGFNRQVAWGVTNVDPDVLDYYRVRFRDNRKTEYRLDNEWAPVSRTVERIRIRGEEDRIDTVLYTRFGPVVYEEGRQSFDPAVPTGYAAKWIAHVAGNEVLTFYELNRAENYGDYVKALAHYVAPAQNFAFASVSGDIAMWANGKFPLKWKEQGKFLLDGTHSSNDWQGWIPHRQNPHVKNPRRGFVSSANQSSTGENYPYYLNWEFSQPDRAIRINELLEGMHRATPDSLRLMQTDNYKKLAEWALPALLEAVNRDQLEENERKAFDILSAWDYRNEAEAIAPSIFETWWPMLETAIWDDEFPSSGEHPMRYPGHDRTVHLLRYEPDAGWYDNTVTPAKESRSDVVTASFRLSVDSLVRDLGPPGAAWQWGSVKGTHVPHILGQEALGSGLLLTGGGKGTINAQNDHNGPSWRMVVALGDTIQAYGIYPGGQSGNPGSPFYDNMIAAWAKGKLNRLVFLQSPEDDPGAITSKTIIE